MGVMGVRVIVIEVIDVRKRVIEIEEGMPHIVQECMCVNCLRRWIDVRPEGVWLKDLECPGCRKIGFVIGTGQVVDEVPS